MKQLIIYDKRPTMQYDFGWKKGFVEYPDVECSEMSLDDVTIENAAKILKSDLVVLLHSADLSYFTFKNILLKKILRFRSGKLIYFPRNEYKGFVAKRGFIKECYVDLVASPLTQKAAEYLYGDLTQTISMPHALDPDFFAEEIPFTKRKTMLGSRSNPYPKILLDDTRNNLHDFVEKLRASKNKWKIDYKSGTGERFSRKKWAEFLNMTKFTIASEPGSIYVDKTDQIEKRINRLLGQQPDINTEDIKTLVKDDLRNLPSGKTVAARNLEAIGCGTCQILTEGEYCNVIEAGVHYIELKKDFSNMEEVVEKMENNKLVGKIISQAREHVINGHTHKHRVAMIMKIIEGLM